MSTQVTSLIEWAGIAATLIEVSLKPIPYEVAATNEAVETWIRLHFLVTDCGADLDKRSA